MVDDPRVVWRDDNQRVSLFCRPGGEIALTRATNYDSGPAQSVTLPAEAIGPLISALFAVQFDRAAARFSEQLGLAKTRKDQATTVPEREEPTR